MKLELQAQATSNATIRVGYNTMIEIKALAQDKDLNLSQLITQIITPFVAGQKSLPESDSTTKIGTTVVLDRDLNQKFKELADKAKLNHNEAFRIAINQYLAEKRHQSDT